MDKLFHPFKTHSSAHTSSGAAARCPVLNPSLRKAQQEVSSDTRPPSPAEILLSKTRDQIYHWPSPFSGFTSTINYSGPEGTFTNQVKIIPGQKNCCGFSNRVVAQWVDYQISEIIAHRSNTAGAHAINQGPLSLGDEDTLWGQRINFVNDPMESFYRIKDLKLTQIGRSYPTQKFLVSIFEQHSFLGLNCARHYNVTYWDRSSGALSKVETFQDEYHEIQGIWIPRSRLYCLSADSSSSRLIDFSNTSLL